MASERAGIVAAGHPLTAEAGAQTLREGGNAVDAAVAALLTSFVAEPLLTGLGAGGYLLTAGPGAEPAAVDVSFGDAAQVFYVGPASCGVYGAPAGVCEAARRWGSRSVAELA